MTPTERLLLVGTALGVMVLLSVTLESALVLERLDRPRLWVLEVEPEPHEPEGEG